MAATEPIRDKNQLKAMRDYFLKRGEIHNYALIVIGVHTVLRIGDLLRLKWSDVYDEERQRFHCKMAGTQKRVTAADDAGTVFINWDSGSGLGVIYGVDRIRKL